MPDDLKMSEDGGIAVAELSKATGGEAPPAKTETRRDEATGKFLGTKSDDEVRALLAAEFPSEFKSGAPTPLTKEQLLAGDKPAESSDASKKDAPAGPDRELVKADSVLDRLKVPASVRDKLDADGRKALAKELKATLVESQRVKQQLADLQKASPAPKAQTESGSVPSQAAEAPSLSALKKATKGIAELYGEEAAAPLEEVLGAFASQLDEIKQHLARSSQVSTQKNLAKARTALQERFPQLEDDDDFTEILNEAKDMERSGRFDTDSVEGLTELLETIAFRRKWTAIEPQSKEETDELAAIRANGTASSKAGRPRQKVLSPEDRDALAVQMAFSPDISIEDAKRKLAGG